jgi:hypothetical protein
MTPVIVVAVLAFLFLLAPVQTIRWTVEQIQERARIWGTLFKKDCKKD